MESKDMWEVLSTAGTDGLISIDESNSTDVEMEEMEVVYLRLIALVKAMKDARDRAKTVRSCWEN